MSGLLDRLKRLSGRGTGEAETPKSGATSPRDTWRDLDPNYNPNMKSGGRSHYDTVDDPKSAPGIWDYHLQAEKAASRDVKQAAFQSVGAKSTSDALDAEVLRKMFAADHVDQIMAMADKNKDGKIDFKEFCDLIRKHPCE